MPACYNMGFSAYDFRRAWRWNCAFFTITRIADSQKSRDVRASLRDVHSARGPLILAFVFCARM